MAWENYGWVWNVVGVQGSEYVVLHCLANEASTKGITPLVPVEKIMRRCNLSRIGVFRYLKRLELKGFIKRERKWNPNRSMDASVFTLDLKRYFPKGDYAESAGQWKAILKFVADTMKETRYKSRVSPEDFATLQRITDAFLQKNSRTLYLMTDAEHYQEILFRNLAPLKEAAVSLKFPIRRFEAFRVPYLK